jgi:hypothetical protein
MHDFLVHPLNVPRGEGTRGGNVSGGRNTVGIVYTTPFVARTIPTAPLPLTLIVFVT